MDTTTAQALKVTAFISLAVALLLTIAQKFSWAGGFLTGAVWAMINFLLILHILNSALMQKDGSKLFAMLLLKFPVLYLIGFLLLISGVFPVLSLVTGASVFLVFIGVIRLCLKPQ